MKTEGNNFPKRLNLIGVAELHFWHGFDRMIKGLSIYYQKLAEVEVHFDIVGEGEPEKQILIQMVKDLKLEKWVHFHGNQFGNELDSLFERSDFGVASLARHRSGITNIKTLKNREYAARGIPFIYSEIDDDFELMPYIIKAPADDSPIDVDRIIEFYSSLKLTPSQIRESIINTLTWKVQMQKVIKETFE
jgi:glycosyltransferase involved in cell wall biosynthesis